MITRSDRHLGLQRQHHSSPHHYHYHHHHQQQQQQQRGVSLLPVISEHPSSTNPAAVSLDFCAPSIGVQGPTYPVIATAHLLYCTSNSG